MSWISIYSEKNTDMHSHFWFYKCQVVRIGKRSPEWRWLKDKKGKSPGKQNKGRSEDQSEDLKQNKQHSWLAQLTQGRPRGMEKKHIKRGAKRLGVSLSCACALALFFFSLSRSLCLLFESFGLTGPHGSRMYFPLFSK